MNKQDIMSLIESKKKYMGLEGGNEMEKVCHYIIVLENNICHKKRNINMNKMY